MILRYTISAIGSNGMFPVNDVQTVEKFNLLKQSLDYRNQVERYSHLRNLPLVEYTNDSPIVPRLA